MKMMKFATAVGEWERGGPEIQGATGGREAVLPLPENQAPSWSFGPRCGKIGRAGQGPSQGDLPSHDWKVRHRGEI